MSQTQTHHIGSLMFQQRERATKLHKYNWPHSYFFLNFWCLVEFHTEVAVPYRRKRFSWDRWVFFSGSYFCKEERISECTFNRSMRWINYGSWPYFLSLLASYNVQWYGYIPNKHAVSFMQRLYSKSRLNSGRERGGFPIGSVFFEV